MIADGSPRSYPPPESQYNWAILSFRNINNLEVGGTGGIDGSGAAWWNKFGTRPTMLMVSNTYNTLIHGITLR